MYTPTRRNRKIGLTQGGRVKYGKPSEKRSHLFSESTWGKLSQENADLIVIKENPSKDYFHPCSPDQIRSVLNEIPKEFTNSIKAVILRRIPKLDEKLFIDARRRYQCIILNSFPCDLKMVWPHMPTSSEIKHMSIWCHNWKEENEKWILQWTVPKVQKYYLYHVLLHEVGHLNDWYHNNKKSREDFAENFALEWARKLGQI